VLRALPQDRLPPFGAVVLLLAACRGRIPEAEDFPGDPGTPGHLEDSARRASIDASLAELKRVASLPDALRANLAAKCALARAVFESAPPQPFGRLQNLRDDVFDQVDPSEFSSYDDPTDDEKHRCLHLVASGLRRHTVESLTIRLRTGLDALPEASPGAVSLPAVQARRLLEELLHDPELRPLAMAARQLMAATQLPRHLHVSDDLAVGGVSDISNRGSIDRLLLSELAHDDLTLAARVALREALYLRHEPPEHQPPLSRCLLIDSGIRLWGLPRLILVAAALAFVAEDLKLESLRAWRPSGRGWVPVNLLSREGLIEHLEALDIDPHPGEALDSLAGMLDADPTAQSILLTHPDVFSDPVFRRRLDKAERPPDFICTLDRQGRFTLHAAPFHSRAPIAESLLDVESLFLEPSARGLWGASAEAENLPAFIKVDPCPMLLPIPGRVDYWFLAADDRCIAALSDRKLVEYDPRDSHIGGRVLCPKLPPGRKLWAEEIDGAVFLVQAGSTRRPNRWVRCRRGDPAEAIDLCGGEPACAVIRFDRVLLVIREHDVYAYGLDDAKLLDRKVSPSRWHRGRYFSSLQQFHLAHWDGRRIEFQPVPVPAQLGLSGIVALFDRAGLEGPWALNHLCQAFPLQGDQKIQIPLPLGQSAHPRNVHVSRDGHRIQLTIPNLGWSQVFDLESGRALPKPGRGGESDLTDPWPTLPAHPLTRSFDAVAIVASTLFLRSRKGDRFAIEVDDQNRWRMTPDPNASDAPWLPFEPIARSHPEIHGCHLQAAATARGGSVCLDSRGLLHLRSANSNAPEATLSLGPGRLAIWTTADGVCGPAFFMPPGSRAAHPELAARTLSQLIAEL
ncbi:MAG: hypothetical protein HYR88_12190, partial [Verrucomicrobia bacterium]|nr:hypothetical protein [Verrucomicrobiota bacterium]